MLSPAQQRGRLRQLIVNEIKTYNIAREFRSALSGNDQVASGRLGGQISYYGSDIEVTVSSDIDSETGYIDDINVTIEMPWGDYGMKLDTEAGDSSNASGQMIPSLDSLVAWISQKGISTTLTVEKYLKSGSVATYNYSDTTSSKRAFAYFVQQNIIMENELRTRNDYAEDIKYDLELAFQDAVEIWFSEIGEDFMGGVYVEIGNIFG